MSSRVGMRRSLMARLSPREQRLVSLMIVVAFVMGAAVLVQMRGARIAESGESIDEMRRALDLVRRHGAAFQEKREAKESRESRIASDPLEFAIELENAAKNIEELTYSNQQEKTAVELGGGLRKRIYSFDLKGVTLTNMLKFLDAIEDQPGRIVHTDRLWIHSPSQVEDSLTVEVEVATWEIDRPEEAAEEEAPSS